jgi:hypothetical protein
LAQALRRFHSFGHYPPTAVPPAFVRDNVPEWGWPHARTLGYTGITGTTEDQLQELLDGCGAQLAEPAADTSAALTKGAATSVFITAYERNPVTPTAAVVP